MKNTIIVVCDSQEIAGNMGMITKAAKLAHDFKKSVFCVMVGKMESDHQKFYEYGCNGMIHCDYEKKLNYYTLAKILEQLIDEFRPDLMMIPATGMYKGAASVIATNLNAGLTADCIDIEYSDKYRYIYCRAAMNSSIEARIIATNEETQMCTVKPTAFVAEKIGSLQRNDNLVIHRKYEVSDISDNYLKVISSGEYIEQDADDINKSEIILGIGRGIKESDIEMIEKIADYYHVSIGGTRIMVDNGILYKNFQIGQSGTSISPKVYIALGISGASQHVVGIKNAQKVIALNMDEKAMIFNYSDYGAICDVHVVIQNLYERIKEKL